MTEKDGSRGGMGALAMRKNPFDRLTIQERAALAKERMSRIVNHMLHLIALRESNEVVLYSDTLIRQIPTSYAANAFNLFRDTVYRYEVVRLCAIWDGASVDRESIPSVAALVEHRAVRKLLAQDAYDAFASKETHFLNPSEDPEIHEIEVRAAREYSERMGCDQAQKTVRGLRKFCSDVINVTESEKMVGLRAHRNNHMAHTLKPKPADAASMERIHYGAEKQLFNQTLSIVHSAYLWVNGSDFQFEDSVKMARRNAKKLWENCAFNIPIR